MNSFTRKNTETERGKMKGKCYKKQKELKGNVLQQYRDFKFEALSKGRDDDIPSD